MPISAAQLERVLEDVSRQVQRIPRSVMVQLAPHLVAAQRELEQDLARWLMNAPDGAQRFTAHQMRVALRQIRGTLETIARLEPTLREALVSGSTRAAALSNSMLSQEIVRLSGIFGGEGTSIARLDIPTLQHLVNRNAWLIPRFERSAARYTADAQRALRHQLSIGVARNETFHQMANRIMRLSKLPGGRFGLDTPAVAGRMADGLFRGNFYRAERIVRTEMMHAYNAHHQRGIEDLHSQVPEVQERWDASIDRRICATCRGLHGVVVGVDELFPGSVAYPPVHPNCRCVVIPWHQGWAEPGPLPEAIAA